MIEASDVVLVGHPFARIGRGEDIRSAHRAFSAHGIAPKVRDVYGFLKPESGWRVEFGPFMASSARARFAIYFLNGDEVEESLLHVGDSIEADYRIVCPAWELERYPEVWGRALERFDEVWAISDFVAESIRRVVSRPVVTMPMAVESRFSRFLGRHWFGIPDDAFVFLFFFDFKSYIARKNPWAVIRAFNRMLPVNALRRPLLAIKSHNDEAAPDRFKELTRLIGTSENSLLISDSLTDQEMKNLVRSADAFVSLHRSEGFGRGLAEAMYLGKPVIGTGYSGNLDYMSDDNSLLVNYSLVECSNAKYPFGNGQYWAEADECHASSLMAALIADPVRARQLGKKGCQSIRRGNSYLAVGRQYVQRLETIDCQGTPSAGGLPR